MDRNKKYALELAKDICIAKLSANSPNVSDANSGKKIGDMLEAIYEKVYEIVSSNDSADLNE